MGGDELSLIGAAFSTVLDPWILFVMVAGVVAGIVVGTIPGLSSVMAISLTLPIAVGLGPVAGLALLGAIYSAALYGGANSAILLNTPGTPSSLPTAFDGYPMTQSGRAGFALYLALFASVFGGLFGTLVLMLAFVPLARLSLLFGPSEFFWLAVLGLTSVASVSPGRLPQGVLAAAVGVFLTTVGQNVTTGDLRYTFGVYELTAGVPLIPALLGLFSISQALVLTEGRADQADEAKSAKAGGSEAAGAAARALFERWWLALRTSAIGAYVGILPGAGGAIASILAYNHARGSDAAPEEYGRGAAGGVIASETANNAQVSSSLVPMMGLGIPGNVNAAVILGALLSFGIQPGLGMIQSSGDVAFAFIASLALANLLMLGIGAMMVPVMSLALRVPPQHLSVGILALCVVGAYAASFTLYGVWVALGLGALGYAMVRADIPIGPLALGLVLGPLAETGLAQSIQIGQGHGGVLPYMATQPISLALVGLIALGVVLAARRGRRARGGPSEEDAAPPQTSRLEIGFLAAILAAAVGLLWAGRNIPPGARVFPSLALAVAILFGVVSLVVALRRASRGDLAPGGIGRAAARAALSTGLYVLMIPWLGFFAASFVFLALGFAIARRRRLGSWGRARGLLASAATALGVLVVVYAVFTGAMALRFPSGWLM